MAAARKKTTTKRAPAAKKTAAKGTRASARKKAIVVEEDYPDEPAGTPSLFTVEWPAKAKTSGKYLGRGYRVKATVGHIMDLPEKKLGIDVDNGFSPDLVPIPGKEKTIADIKAAAKTSREVLI